MELKKYQYSPTVYIPTKTRMILEGQTNQPTDKAICGGFRYVKLLLGYYLLLFVSIFVLYISLEYAEWAILAGHIVVFDIF